MLTQFVLSNAKPKDKAYTLSDGAGLHLFVQPNGSKLWRFRYRFNGKANMLAFGSFPEVSIADARTKRDAARKLVAQGIDPSQKKKTDKLAAGVAAANTFSAVTNEYIEKLKADGLAETKASFDVEGKQALAPFQHLKAQCAFKLAELVETHKIAVRPGGDQDEVAEEFAQIRQRDGDKDGKLKIIGKDEVREALGRSPDTGDTFIMRMYFELLKDATGSPNQPYDRSVRDMSRRNLTRGGHSRGV